MQETAKQADVLLEKVRQAMQQLKVDQDRSNLAELEKSVAEPGFWSRADAGDISQQAAALRRHIEDWERLETEVREVKEIAQAAADDGTQDDSLEAEAKTMLAKAEADYQKREAELKLAGPYDKNAAIVSVYAGTGGTDAQDWAEMLLRMYLRWCEKAGYSTTVLDQSPGEEAGIKSVTFEANGQFAYGRLKGEKGVHRLVRLSPYNSDNLRQTSFALVEVMPRIEKLEAIEIDPKELKTDVFRAGGHGGQSVNTTDSAVRLTHLPTGLVVSIQNERSQLQNKEKALAILKSRLAVMMEEQHKAKVSEIKGQTQSAAWGNQIRSYVLHPYTKVKDHRTDTETSQAQAVLDGDLDMFIDAYLKSQIGS